MGTIMPTRLRTLLQTIPAGCIRRQPRLPRSSDLATPAAVTAQLLLAPQLAGGLAARPVAPTERLGPAQARLPVTAGIAVKAQKAPVEPLHQDTCCCGSLACHAGVMAAFVTIVNPYRLGERLRPRPVLASVRATLDGIERPPRAPFES